VFSVHGRTHHDGKGVDVRRGVLDSPSPSLWASPEVVPRQAVGEALGLGRKYHRSFQVGDLDVAPYKVAVILFEGICHDVCGFDICAPCQHTCHTPVKGWLTGVDDVFVVQISEASESIPYDDLFGDGRKRCDVDMEQSLLEIGEDENMPLRNAIHSRSDMGRVLDVLL